MVLNLGLLFYTKRVSTMPSQPCPPLPASHAHFRHGHIAMSPTPL